MLTFLYQKILGACALARSFHSESVKFGRVVVFQNTVSFILLLLNYSHVPWSCELDPAQTVYPKFTFFKAQMILIALKNAYVPYYYPRYAN